MKSQESNGLVSIIIPAYNLESYIGNCPQSIVSQTHENLEIIVIDDGSSDRTIDVLKEYQTKHNRIKLISQVNGGAARARNKGLESATGEYITFVDGDDMLDCNTIEVNLNILQDDLSIDWVAFPIIRTDENGNPISVSNIYSNKEYPVSRTITAEEFVPAYHNKELSGVCCGAIYRKSSISNIRFPEGEYYEDSFFFIDLLSTTSKGYLSNKGRYLYVHRPGSSQLVQLDKAHLMSNLACGTKRLKQYRERFPQYENIYKVWENGLYYFYKNEVAKKTEGANEVFLIFCQHMNYRHDINCIKELKFLTYKFIGYHNLKKLLQMINRQR